MQLNSISNIRPTVNRALIKIPYGNNKVRLSSGVEVNIDVTFNPGKHVDVYGEVVALPLSKISRQYCGVEMSEVLEYDNDIDIQIGDIVYFDYLTSLIALGLMADKDADEGADIDTMYINVDNSVYVFIRLDQIFLSVRGKEIIMHNGYLLVENVDKKNDLCKYMIDKQIESNVGIVRYLGGCNRSYLSSRSCDTRDININDRVIFRDFNNQYLENQLHISLLEGKGLYKMQRRSIVGKIED